MHTSTHAMVFAVVFKLVELFFQLTIKQYKRFSHATQIWNQGCLVKESGHAVFDEAWYMQPFCPLAAQLLYDLELEAEDCMVSEIGPDP